MITIKYERKCDGEWMECEELYINTQPGMRSVINKALKLKKKEDVRNLKTYGNSGNEFTPEDMIWSVI